MRRSLFHIGEEALNIYRKDGVRELSYRMGLFCIPNSVKYWYWIRQLRSQAKNETDADPFKILWIDPSVVSKCTGTTDQTPSNSHLDHNDAFSPEPDRFGSVKRGNWDKDGCSFEELAVYQGLQERFVQDKEWEDTTFFQKHNERIKSHGRSFGCTSRRELLDRLDSTDLLFDRIRREGAKTQRKLGGKPHREIILNIGRDGELLFNGGGRHRLSMAKILGLKSIPVLVLVRHSEWQTIRDKISKIGFSINESINQNHPDLQDLQDDESYVS